MLQSISGFSFLNPKKRRTFQEITGTFSVPTISFASATTSSVTTTITNFDAALTYAVSSSAGTAVRSTNSVTVSGLSANQSVTVTVTATGSGGLEFSTTSSEFPSLPATPTLSRSGGTTTTVTVAIGNFDAGLTYTIGSSVGSATRSGNTITVTGLTQGQATTVTATASNSSGSSTQGSLATGAVPETPTLSFASSTESTATFTITNFNAAYTYSVSSSSGSASRSGNTITVTGVAENTSVTAFATATANSVASAQGSASGTTLLGGAFERIQTINVTSTASSVTFSSIPQTYSHLFLVATPTGSSAANMSMQFNGQSGGTAYKFVDNAINYLGSGNSTLQISNTHYVGLIANNTEGAQAFTADFYNYSSTSKKKHVFPKIGRTASSSDSYMGTNGGILTVNNDAITSISISLPVNFSANQTKFTLYGIRG